MTDDFDNKKDCIDNDHADDGDDGDFAELISIRR